MSAPTNYRLVSADEFSTLSIANTTTATANWYSGQAWGGGFSDARFKPVGTGSHAFSIVDKGGESALQILMQRNAAGQLESGLISNTFADGTSKTPQDGNPYGYYEVRMWLPGPDKGIWPAFWGIEKERLSATRDHVWEIDTLEHYGAAMPDQYSTVLHDWNWNGTTLEGHTSSYTRKVMGTGVVNTGWHTYGTEITPERITFYFDDQPYWSVATPATLDTDVMWMINLAAGGGWPIDPALDNVKMYIDYFRAYERVSPPVPASAPKIMRTGTSGNDTFNVDDTMTAISEQPGAGYDTVRATVSYTLDANVEKLVLNGTAALSGTGNNEDNQIIGNTGANKLSGLAGNDYLYGRAGDDVLLGDDGNDKLYGEDGNDHLTGGLGCDRLEGGAGADTFYFGNVAESTKAASDTIIDFNGAAGDRIHLGDLDANTLVAGDQAFTFIGASAFTEAGQLRLEKGFLMGDVNGDKVADLCINVGKAAILASYIVL